MGEHPGVTVPTPKTLTLCNVISVRRKASVVGFSSVQPVRKNYATQPLQTSSLPVGASPPVSLGREPQAPNLVGVSPLVLGIQP